MNFNVLDIIFIALIVSFTLLSMMRGAVKEVLSLLGLVGGFFLANWFYADLAGQIGGLLPDPALAEVASYLLILVAGYVGVMFLGGLGEAFRSHHHVLLNRGLGGMIGIVKGTTISLALHWMIISYIPPFQDELSESMLARELGQLFSFMEGLNLIP